MHSGELAVEIGDGGDQRRPGLDRRAIVRPIVTTRMEAQISGFVESVNAAMAQIRLGKRARDQPRNCEQASRRLRRARERRLCAGSLLIRFWRSLPEAEKAPSLVDDVSKIAQSTRLADNVEQIAVFGRRRVRPICPLRPCRLVDLSGERTGYDRAHFVRRRPTSSSPRVGRWRDNAGKPPPLRARDDSPAQTRLNWTWRTPPRRKGLAIAGESLLGWPRGGLFGGDVLGGVHRRVISIALSNDFVDSRFVSGSRRFFDDCINVGSRHS